MQERESHNPFGYALIVKQNKKKQLQNYKIPERESHNPSATPSLSNKTKNFKTTKYQREKAITFRLRPHGPTQTQVPLWSTNTR